MRSYFFILLFVSSTLNAQEVQEPPAKPPPSNPIVAVQLALADAQTLAPEIARQRRYLWCPNGSENEHAAAAFAINTALAHSSVDVIPVVLGGGYLVSVDLKVCAPVTEDYKRLDALWERFAEREPYFHVRGVVKRTVPEYTAKDGKKYTFIEEEGFVRAPYLGEPVIELETITNSRVPVLRLDQWMVRALDTINGGLYYELRGLDTQKTRLDDYLVSRGASRQQAARTQSDEKAIFISEVTGKARVVTMFATTGTRLSVGLGVAAITDDPFDETTGADFDPMRNFLDAKTNGHEVFVTTPSGWIEFTIWDAAGNLVREAPPNLVADHRIPEPYTRRLQGAISCIRCHGSQELWQPFTNEVAVMLAGEQVDVFGDLKGGNNQAATLERLAGLYSGNLSEVLIMARNGFARRVFNTCKMDVIDVTSALSKIYNDYVFGRVTAKVACHELGIVVPEDDLLGVETFKRAVPPLPVIDDPIIARLQRTYEDPPTRSTRGLTLTRKQWEGVFADAYIRMLAARQAAQQQAEGDQK